MNSFEKSIPRKNTKISFRTDEATLAKLKTFCRIENRTISSLIENVLMDHVLRVENPMLLQGDKRQSPRKECSLPAIILLHNDTQKHSCNGIIINLSLSSIQLLLKQHPSDQLLENNFFVLFSVPNMDNPMLVQCSLVRANFLHEECMIIAKFVKIEPNELKAINKFLTAHDFSDMKKNRQTS
jgi:hypothetical protein